MRNIRLLFFCFLAVSFVMINAQDFKYVGSKTCGMCHKKDNDGNQLKVWEESAHSKAFETLKSDEAAAVMKKLGLTTKAYETDKCLSCHTTGHGKPATAFDKKFKAEDGVQCESCHGPGSEYKSMKVMKNKDDAVAKGLIIYANDEAIKAQCVTCHNSESPTFKEFKFAEMYAKIKHNKPEAK